MICVYPANCTDFSGNGLGAVTPMSCTVTETLNGEWELTLVHDIDEHGKWTRLAEGCILRAPVPAAMTPSVGLVTQQYQTSTYDVQIYKITTKSGPLHLRSGTGTNYKILGKYKKGREVIVLNKTTSSWYEVTAPDGKHGYMASQYLTFQRTETQTVQTNVGFRNQVIEARQLRDQPFRIYRVVPELDKVTVYARHIFYDLLDNMIKSLKPSPSAVGASVVQSLSGACLSSHDFSFHSDLTSTAEDVEWENVNPVEAMLGENGLVSKYGAELARDWYDVFLVRRVGNNTDVSIREKKNLTGISYDVDETDVVTRMPAAPRGGMIIGSIPTEKDKPALSASTVRSRLWVTRRRIRNTAAMPAILRRDMARGVKAVDDRAFSYISAMAAARKMRDSGILTDKDYLTVEEAMREKYGVPKGSIYRDFDLICPNFRAIMSHHKEVAECP